MIDRRGAIVGAAVTLLAGCGQGRLSALGKTGGNLSSHVEGLRRIEQAARGRLGAFILDPASGTSFGWRENERFTHCSSFKLSLAAMLLAGADKGTLDLDEILHWQKADVLSYSPVTSKNISGGLTVRELARAALVTSDNTAANTLLRRFGGPEALTRFWRAAGDKVSRLDRYEPELNHTPPGTALDTTTPAAMAQTVGKLVTGDILEPASRTVLREWMMAVSTGRKRIRAGFPADWVAGDKTGTGIGETRHTYADLAFGGPKGAPPVIVAAYFEPERLAPPIDAVSEGALADVGRLAAAAFPFHGGRA
ncbi:class A beta-lactamase [Novosphingobium beihaiensis]|uniref:beta-lactamase n=1 Tax=Novosphingobium beihaiensis TaxID=2930389 RepID=A0ABT0BK15_9SPHN|nr:class A beta-lactamase [Novosphingobium beihaiensis]MCJ2185406.1 class A beta-lactamase [Novosphingobium beihaiensis]